MRCDWKSRLACLALMDLVSMDLMHRERSPRQSKPSRVYIWWSNFSFVRILYFKTQPGSDGKNGNLGPRAGNWTHDPTNLVQCYVNWATKSVVESLATGSVFLYWLCLNTQKFPPYINVMAETGPKNWTKTVVWPWPDLSCRDCSELRDPDLRSVVWSVYMCDLEGRDCYLGECNTPRDSLWSKNLVAIRSCWSSMLSRVQRHVDNIYKSPKRVRKNLGKKVDSRIEEIFEKFAHPGP